MARPPATPRLTPAQITLRWQEWVGESPKVACGGGEMRLLLGSVAASSLSIDGNLAQGIAIESVNSVRHADLMRWMASA